MSSALLLSYSRAALSLAQSSPLLACAALACALLLLLRWSRLPAPFSFALGRNADRDAAAVALPQYAGLPESVLVTGGCGFLGAHLVAALARQRAVRAVAAFDLVERAPPPEALATADASASDAGAPVEFVRGDLLDTEALTRELVARGVRCVMHAASPPPDSADAALFERVNVRGTASVLAACRKAGVRALVFTSSASVVWRGAPHDGPGEAEARVRERATGAAGGGRIHRGCGPAAGGDGAGPGAHRLAE